MLRKSYRSRRIYRMSFTNYIRGTFDLHGISIRRFSPPIDDTRVAFHRIRLNLYIAYPTWRINKELFHQSLNERCYSFM